MPCLRSDDCRVLRTAHGGGEIGRDRQRERERERERKGKGEGEGEGERERGRREGGRLENHKCLAPSFLASLTGGRWCIFACLGLSSQQRLRSLQ